jgi:epoxyqueuosine reductase
MEKVWGAETLLGWMGKHSNLITRERGSWFFIGVILSDVELEYDGKEADYCGSCTRCIAVCPTGAIVRPYVVDARLCISYLTIEWRGTIPRSLRPRIGNRIYGCDDCQDVCPWNRFARATSEPALRPRAGSFNPDLISLVDLTPAEFERRFRQSAVLRVKRNGFIRNVVIALGNSGSPAAAEPLARALCDESVLVRAHALWALQRLGTPEARVALERRRPFETDPSVLEEFDTPA